MIDKINDKSALWELFWKRYPNEFAQLSCLEAKLGYYFRDRSLLYEAVVHRSALQENSANSSTSMHSKSELPWNERLEFLGDSVLGLIVSTMLWRKDENLSEGQFSQMKASLVNEDSLATLACQLSLPLCLTVGLAERKAGGHLRPSLLADALEALIGAIYLDSSYNDAQLIVQKWYQDSIGLIESESKDWKTRLQELTQALNRGVPQYMTLAELGPPHARTFCVAVVLEEQTLGQAEGTSKKRASQAAAKIALETLSKMITTKENLAIKKLVHLGEAQC